jgi:hypothetical protein
VWLSWWRTTVQLSAEAGSGPSSASVAVARSTYAPPTVNWSPAAGEVIDAVGAVLPARMVTVAGRETAPAGSRTRSVAVYVPAA